jgi:hypothetical protein
LDESFVNDERERRRLEENYAGMTDGELQRLARSAESLTELAWDALEHELDRRHLDFDELDFAEDEYPDGPLPPPRQQMEMRELVTRTKPLARRTLPRGEPGKFRND